MWVWRLTALLLCSLTTGARNDEQGKKVADQQARQHDMEMKIDKLQSTVNSQSTMIASLVSAIKKSGMNHRVHKHKQRHHKKISEEQDEQWTKKQTIQLAGDTVKRTGEGEESISISDRINKRLDEDFAVFEKDINENKDLSDAEKEVQIADLTAKRDTLKESLTASDKGAKLKASDIAPYETMLLGIIPKIPLVFKPTLTITQRVQAGIDIAAFIMKIVPPPLGPIGSVLLKSASAILGLSIPTTNEYTKLRNDILDGVQNMFDREQFADTSGCLYKIEFIQNILKEFKDPNTMKEREFFSLMLLGGIDLGVSTLGALKWKMEDFRERNTIMDGRRAIDMAHYYVLLAQARDGLYEQILQFLEMNKITDPANLQLSSLFFQNAQRVAKIGHKDLFWLDDVCCKQKPKHISALIAYNLPIDKHQGEGKAVDVIKQFIAKYRTQDYYKEEVHGMNANNILSVDEVDEKTGLPTMKKKKNPLDGNHWYRFQNVYDTTKYIGINHNEVKVGYWSRTGDSISVKVSNKMKAVTQILPTRTGKLICSHDGTYVYHMGITNTFHSSKLKIKFPEPDEPVKPNTATSSDDPTPSDAIPQAQRPILEAINMIEIKDKDTFTGEIDEIEEEYIDNKERKVKKYIVASRDGVKLAVEKEKVTSVDATKEGTRFEEEKSKQEEAKKIAEEMDQQRKPWDMFVLCKEAEDQMPKEKLKAKLKVFPVKMPGWDETRYLVVPGGDVMGSELTAFGYDQWGTGTFTTAHIESNKVTIPPADQNKEKDTLTEDMLKQDKWKKLFFTVPYSSETTEGVLWSAVAVNTGETHKANVTCRPSPGYLEGIVEENDDLYLAYIQEKMGRIWGDHTNRVHSKYISTYTFDECVSLCLGRRKTKPYIEGVVWASNTGNPAELELKECYCMKGVTREVREETGTGHQHCIFVGEKVTYDIATSGKCASVSRMQCFKIASSVPGFVVDKNWKNGNMGENDVQLYIPSGCTYEEKNEQNEQKKNLAYNFVLKHGYDKNQYPKGTKQEYQAMLSDWCSKKRPCVCAPGTVGQIFESLGCWKEKGNSNEMAVPDQLVTDAGENHKNIGTKRLENVINECYKSAVQEGYKKFALSNEGRCGGVRDNPEEDYTKHGPMDTCASGIGSFGENLYTQPFGKSTLKFASLANDVYKILDQSVIQQPQSAQPPQASTDNSSVI